MSDSARDWPVGEWQNLVRRVQLTRTEHSVAMTLSTYADFSTGRRARPGIAVLAVDCKLSYNVTSDALGRLRALGLIEITRRSRGRGSADEYRLTVAPDLLERIDVMTPEQVRTAAELMRRARRGAVRRSRTRRATATEQQPGARVVAAGPETEEQPGARVVAGDDETRRAGFTAEEQPGARVSNNPPRDPPPPRDHTPTTTHTVVTGDSDHQAAREPARTEPGDSSSEHTAEPAGPLPERCPHGLPARRRSDGSSTCALCRREIRESTEPDRHPRAALRVVS